MVRVSRRERRLMDEGVKGDGSLGGSDVESSGREDVQEGGDAGETTPAQANLFANLEAEEEDEDSSAGEGQVAPDTKTDKVTAKKKKKKKKNKKVNAGPSSVTPTPPLESPAAASTPKKARQTPSKARDAESRVSEMSMEEFDAILKSAKSSASQSRPEENVISASQPSSSALQLRSMLSVDPKMLDAEAEMRRMFGARVVEAATNELSQQEARSRRGRGMPGANARDNPLSKLQGRGILAKPKPTWPRDVNVGLEMHKRQTGEQAAALFHGKQSGQESDGQLNKPWVGEMWWTFTTTRAYAMIQRQFLQCVGSGDPSTLQALLQVYPYHVDTLLQVSEIWKQQGDLGLATDLLERALFAIERCMPPSFNLTSGSNRLSFSDQPSRSFYLALARSINNLSRRGCWKTAFSTAKLLLSLDPYGDPHGAQLWLDFLAPKAGLEGWRWLVSWYEDWSSGLRLDNEGLVNPRFLPGMQFSRALVEMFLEKHSKKKDHSTSTQLLHYAILYSPEMVIVLMAAANLGVPKDYAKIVDGMILYSHEPTKVHASTQNFLCALYAERAGGMWKEPEIAQWLAETVATLPLQLLKLRPSSMDDLPDLPLSFARHLVVSDIAKLNIWLPKHYSSSPILSFDPLGPALPQNSPPDRGRRQFDEQLTRVIEGIRLDNDDEPEDVDNQLALIEQLNAMLDADEADGSRTDDDVSEVASDDETDAAVAPAGQSIRGLLDGLFRAFRGPRNAEADE